MARDDRWRPTERYRENEDRWQGGRDYRGRSREDVTRDYGDPGRGSEASHGYGPTETGFGESVGRDENRRFGSGAGGGGRGRGFNPDYGGHGGSSYGRGGGSGSRDYGRGGDYGRGSSSGPSFSNDARDFDSREDDWRGGYGHGHGSYSYGSEGGGWGREDYRSGGGVYGSPDYGRGYGYDSEEPVRRSRGSYGGERGGERSFWDRASDEVSSWFGDDAAERRRREDEMRAEHRGRGPRGYARSDDRIRDDVCDRLTEHPWVDASDIEVSVSNSEVTLSGTVGTRDQRRRAEDVVEHVSGVTHVQNNLRVASQSQSQFQSQGRGAAMGAGTGAAAAGGSSIGSAPSASSAAGATSSTRAAGDAPRRTVTSGSFNAPGERSDDTPTGAFSEVVEEKLDNTHGSGAGSTGATAAGSGAKGAGTTGTAGGTATGRNVT